MKQDWKVVLSKIQEDPRYLENLDWGKPRRGHPEGTIRAHIEQLERNLACVQREFRDDLSHQDVGKLRLLIHVYDTFKPDAKAGVSIEHPNSHASLAASFLQEFLQSDDDELNAESRDLIAMVQNHDVGYALWRKASHRKVDGRDARFRQLLEDVEDWPLFSGFLVIDNCTTGKSRVPLAWFLQLVADLKPEVTRWESCSLLGLPHRS